METRIRGFSDEKGRHANSAKKNKKVEVLPSLHLDVKDPDEVGPLWVVFNQTGDAAAPLAPAGVAVGCEHLDHGGGQRLWRSTKC